MKRHGEGAVRRAPRRGRRDAGLRRLTTLALVLLATTLLSPPGVTSEVEDRALSLIGATTPGPPQNATATPGDQRIRVTWAAPEDDGGSPITSYTVSVGPGDTSATTPDGNTFAATVTGLTNGTAYTVTVQATNAVGSGPVALARLINSSGYWFVASDGGIFAYGDAPFLGSMGSTPLNQPMVGMAANTAAAAGYWTVAADGGIFSFGTAPFFGSMGSTPLNQPIVGMAATATGLGYWFVASDGGIFNFGDAGFFQSAGNIGLNSPIVGMAPTASGQGYWLVASDGGVFAFGDAVNHGSMGGIPLNEPVVGMAATVTGGGYWLVAEDGGIFSFGDAAFHGSAGSIPLNRPIVGMAATPTGNGYWFVAGDGGIFSYGDAEFFGSTGDITLNRPVVGMAAVGRGTKVIPLGFPGPVRDPVATGGDGVITVTWRPPLDDGGCAITEYIVTASPGGAEIRVPGGTHTATFTDLPEDDYNFNVVAVNCLGSGAFTTAANPDGGSAPIFFAQCPGKPLDVTATDPGVESATVSWDPPNKKTSITGYTVTPYIGDEAQATTTVNGSTTSVVIHDLEPETDYTFTVTASNENCTIGENADSESDPSNVITTGPAGGPSGPSA